MCKEIQERGREGGPGRATCRSLRGFGPSKHRGWWDPRDRVWRLARRCPRSAVMVKDVRVRLLQLLQFMLLTTSSTAAENATRAPLGRIVAYIGVRDGCGAIIIGEQVVERFEIVPFLGFNYLVEI